jgi:hypothetical protein
MKAEKWGLLRGSNKLSFQLTIAYGFAAIIHSKCGDVHNIISPPLQIVNPHTPRDMVCPHEYAIYMWSGAQPTWSTDTHKV